ncbi:MAG: ABC transporter substrate-binding protein [Rhodospirillaceae bacterium]|mgnify:CR=1 FL=1|nr:ABC transporter substrate-binding protein [Rhodospirillaceae bacterium]
MGIANHMTAKCVALLSALLVAIASPNAETLRIGVATRTPGLGNPFASMISGGVHPSTLIFDALVQIDEAGRVVPVLATSWENTSPVTWVFRLREDISFANGEPFNASTVVAIIAYLKTAAAQRYFVSGEVARIATVKAVDDYTVEFRTDSPDAIFPKRLVMILMVPERAWLELGPDDFGLQPIGTGPFSLVDWGMDSGRARFVRNPTSWRNVRQLTGIEFAIIGESVSRAQALVSDQIDIAYGLEFEALRQLKEDGYRTLVKETPIVGALALPNIDPEHPLADVRVRRALNYGTNRQLIASILLNGSVEANGQGAIPGVVGYNPDIDPYPYDPDRARALLKDAGYENGLSFRADVQLSAGVPEAVLIYQSVAQDLRGIGVDLEIRPTFTTDWIRKWFSGDWGDADIISSIWNTSAYMDAIRAIENVSCSKAGAFFCLPEMMADIDATRTNFDPISREQQLQRLLARLHGLAPSLYLFPQTSIFAFSDRVHNITFGRQQIMIEEIEMRDE